MEQIYQYEHPEFKLSGENIQKTRSIVKINVEG
jgi:hypothetical protein